MNRRAVTTLLFVVVTLAFAACSANDADEETIRELEDEVTALQDELDVVRESAASTTTQASPASTLPATTTTAQVQGTTTVSTTATITVRGSLGITPRQFQEAWNQFIIDPTGYPGLQFLVSAGYPELRLPQVTIIAGEAQDTVSHEFPDGIPLEMSVNRADGTMRNAVVLVDLGIWNRKESDLPLGAINALVFASTSPAVLSDQWLVMNWLGFTEVPYTGPKLELVEAGVSYSTRHEEGGRFSVRAEDPADTG